MQMLAIDLAKQSFHVHGMDAEGRVISRRVGRAKLLGLVESLAPEIVAMEACATAHHWARAVLATGCEVRLINPRFVKPFVRGSKNDAVDAEAIFDAASRPTMRFVPVKSTEQQDLQSLHRVRDRLVSQRTNLINHTRGLLAEYGLVYPKGAARFADRVRAELTEVALSPMARETFEALLDELEALEVRIERLEGRLRAICREDAACRRLMGLPGVGPVVATALRASIGDARQFGRGASLPPGSAWSRASTRPAASPSSGRGPAGQPLPAAPARPRRPGRGTAAGDQDRLDLTLVPVGDRPTRVQQGYRRHGQQDGADRLGPAAAWGGLRPRLTRAGQTAAEAAVRAR